MEKKDQAVEGKIQTYLQIAFEKGIEKAIQEVKKSRDPYLVDAFHDRLVLAIKRRQKEDSSEN